MCSVYVCMHAYMYLLSIFKVSTFSNFEIAALQGNCMYRCSPSCYKHQRDVAIA